MRNQLIEKANQSPELHSVRANDLPQMPQLQVDIDSNKAVSLGLSLNDVTDTLSSAWAVLCVNDFIDRGRVKKVYIQGDSEFRSAPSDLGKWFVRGSDNAMTPFSALRPPLAVWTGKTGAQLGQPMKFRAKRDWL